MSTTKIVDCIHANILVTILYYTIVLQNISIGGNWAKCTRDLSVLFITTACEFIFSIKISIKRKVHDPKCVGEIRHCIPSLGM